MTNTIQTTSHVRRFAGPDPVVPGRLRPGLALIAVPLIAMGLSLVQPAAAQELDAQDMDDLRRVEMLLESIDTLQARFTQVSETQGYSEGDFFLDRPGRMRIEYDDQPYLYVADGFWLTFYDEELDQRSDALLGSTLADFITREDVSLEGDVTVVDVRRSSEELAVDLVQTDDPGAGMLSLIMNRDPMTLKRWVVLDSQGYSTEVYLQDIQYGVDLPGSLFVVRQGG